jgi:hypothetical protein
VGWAGLGVGILIGAAVVRFGERVQLPAPAPLPVPERVERPCDPASPDTAIIVIHGQSNASNFGALRYQARHAVDNFDSESGRCFAAVDPLLGADWTGGHFGTRLGDLLVESGRYKRVVIATASKGGASIEALNTTYAERLDNLIAKMKAAGLRPTHILFQQGETDAHLTTTTEQYVTQVHRLVGRLRAAGIAAPFYLSQSTKCDYDKPANIEPIRQAQLRAVDAALDIRRGPDTDAIGNDGRDKDDGCHMNAVGTLANAALWAAFIQPPR